MRARGEQNFKWALVTGLMLLSLTACSMHVSAHESRDNKKMHTIDEKQLPEQNIAMAEVSYFGQIDNLVGGQPYQTSGYTMLDNAHLQFSKIRSDGQLLALRESTTTGSAPRFTNFEPNNLTPPAVAKHDSPKPLTELLPSLLVAAQTQDGAISIYDRTRREHPDHAYHEFLRHFADSMEQTDSITAKPGTYLQVTPYLGDGPVNIVVTQLTVDLEKYMSEPFWLHFTGTKRHVVIGKDFIVLPKRPVLASIGNQRYVFSVYIYAKQAIGSEEF